MVMLYIVDRCNHAKQARYRIVQDNFQPVTCHLTGVPFHTSVLSHMCHVTCMSYHMCVISYACHVICMCHVKMCHTCHVTYMSYKGPFKCYVTQMGGGGCVCVRFSGKKRYEGVRFNVISVTRGWVGIQFPGKKCYVTLEWPPNVCCVIPTITYTSIGQIK